MTIEQLIERLGEFPKDRHVYVIGDEDVLVDAAFVEEAALPPEAGAREHAAGPRVVVAITAE